MFMLDYNNELKTILKKNPIIYKYISLENGLKVLKNKNLRFRRIKLLNDPFEANPFIYQFINTPDDFDNQNKEHQVMVDEFARLNNIRNDVYISCFSTKWNIIPMWSHYGEHHRGICIGFNSKSLSESLNSQIKWLRVTYNLSRKKYLELSEEERRCCYSNVIKSKSKDWRIESEIRLYYESYRNVDYIDFQFNSESVTEIYCGLNFFENNKCKRYKFNDLIKNEYKGKEIKIEGDLINQMIVKQ